MIDDPEFRYASHLLGHSFLAYVTNVDEDEIRARLDGASDQLPGRSEPALAATLAHALSWAPAPPASALVPDGARPDGSPSDRMRRFAWVDLNAEQSLANLVRMSSGGALPNVPLGLDPGEKAVAEAAIDYFSVTLIPVSRPDQPFSELPVISHARVDAFAEAMTAENSLARLFDPATRWYTSTGFGFQGQTPMRIMGCIVANAEQQVRAFDHREAVHFVNAAVEGLRTVRRLCEHGRATVPALIGFAHVALPEKGLARGPRGGRLRQARTADLRVPTAAPATIVLETSATVGLSFGEDPPTGGPFWEGVGQLSRDGEIVSLAGLLTTADHEPRALPVVTWEKIFDPLSPFTGAFKRERREHADVSLVPRDVSRFEDWVERLDKHYHVAVSVAIKRCISAFAERETPDDALIDLVIALENLFGNRAELRLRISAALAWLLAVDPTERAGIQAETKSVYDARSKLVHGGELTADEALKNQLKAEHLLLRAFDKLFTTRTDLVPDRERATKLMLGS